MNIFNDMYMDPMINISSNTLFNPYEGYMKGNMYKNLYNEYKDYKPSKLIPNSEQAELLLNINQICFENQDIRIYLDVFPTDKSMIDRYNKNNNLIKELTNNYEVKYGPLTWTSISNSEYFNWEEDNFPWEEVNR